MQCMGWTSCYVCCRQCRWSIQGLGCKQYPTRPALYASSRAIWTKLHWSQYAGPVWQATACTTHPILASYIAYSMYGQSSPCTTCSMWGPQGLLCMEWKSGPDTAVAQGFWDMGCIQQAARLALGAGSRRTHTRPAPEPACRASLTGCHMQPMP